MSTAPNPIGEALSLEDEDLARTRLNNLAAQVAAETERATASIHVDPEAPAPGLNAVSADQERVDLGGYMVPLRWALSWARGDCTDCSGQGFIMRAGQKGVRLLCHRCVIPRATRKLGEHVRASAAPRAIALAPAAPDADEEARHARKVAALRRNYHELEDELTRRGVKHSQAVLREREGLATAITAEQDGSSRVLAQTVRTETLRATVAALEEQLAEKRLALTGAETALEAERKTHDAAAATHFRLERPIRQADERFEKDTAGLRGEIVKARRRLDMALARNGAPAAAEVTP